jgi:hypothetical protein
VAYTDIHTDAVGGAEASADTALDTDLGMDLATFRETTKDFRTAERLLTEFFRTYDPDQYGVDDANDMLWRISPLCRLLDAARLSTASRLQKADLHTSEGFKDAGRWLSGITGETAFQSAAMLEVAKFHRSPPGARPGLQGRSAV